MRKLLLFFALFVAGCTYNDEITYTRSDKEIVLKITQRSPAGSAISIELRTHADAQAYRERLERIMKELDDFERELTIKEKK
jgi:hypothetical protein